MKKFDLSELTDDQFYELQEDLMHTGGGPTDYDDFVKLNNAYCDKIGQPLAKIYKDTKTGWYYVQSDSGLRISAKSPYEVSWFDIVIIICELYESPDDVDGPTEYTDCGVEKLDPALDKYEAISIKNGEKRSGMHHF